MMKTVQLLRDNGTYIKTPITSHAHPCNTNSPRIVYLPKHLLLGINKSYHDKVQIVPDTHSSINHHTINIINESCHIKYKNI